MTLDQARKFYQDIKDLKRRYGVSYSDYHEEERDGEIRFVNITVKAKIDPLPRKMVKKIQQNQPCKCPSQSN